jgi:hypothetical protein
MAQNLNAAQTLHLDAVRRELAAAPHGAKAPIVARAAQHLGVAPATVHRWLAQHLRHDSGRKRRTDAGARGVQRAELEQLSAALTGTFRKTGRRIMTFDTAVQMLRENGEISTALSPGRLATLLTEHGLHPSQMTRPTPSVEQRSLHPNHVWQVDASVCVAYYLSNATGLQVMDEAEFYKNKPANLTRVQQERLIRYTVADHYEHELLTRYYLGSECALHLADFLIWCFAPKLDAAGRAAHVMHGVPFILQMDMGSANTSAAVLNLCDRMDIRVIVHERRNSRANGSVEKAHHLVELHFESSLRFARVESLEDLNAKALTWANVYGAQAIHTRYGNTRHALWLTITAEQLRLAPPEDVMRELVTTHPRLARVNNNLEVQFAHRSFGSRRYDVRYVPGVMAGAKVEVVLNPYRMPAIDVGYVDEATGEQRWITVAPLELDDVGRRLDGPVIGEELRASHRGVLEHNRDAVLLRSYGDAQQVQALPEGATTKERVAAAERAQEAGALVFGGRVDPFKRAAEAVLPAFMPKRGTALDAAARNVEPARLNPVDACKAIRAGLARLGLADAYDAQRVFAWVSQRFGAEGAPEDQVDALCAQLAAQYMTDHPAPAEGGLRVVAGGTTP